MLFNARWCHSPHHTADRLLDVPISLFFLLQVHFLVVMLHMAYLVLCAVICTYPQLHRFTFSSPFCQLMPKTGPSKPSDHFLGEGTRCPLREHVDTPKIVEICPENHHQRRILSVTLVVGGCVDCSMMWWYLDTICKLLENISHFTKANKINQFLKQLWECMKIFSKCQWVKTECWESRRDKKKPTTSYDSWAVINCLIQ